MIKGIKNTTGGIRRWRIRRVDEEEIYRKNQRKTACEEE